MTYEQPPKELIDFCMSCGYRDCPGICPEYMQYARSIGAEVPMAIRPNGPKKSVKESRTSFETKLDCRNAPMVAFGEVHTLKEWSDIRGLRYHTLYMRVRSGYDLETALTTPVRDMRQGHPQKMITAFGKTQPIRKWSEETGLPYQTIVTRIWQGWSSEEAVSTPPLQRGKSWAQQREELRNGRNIER